MALSKPQVVGILRTDPLIQKMNFQVDGSVAWMKVWPKGYSHDVANAFDSGEVTLKEEGKTFADAMCYRPNFDRLEYFASWDITNGQHRAMLLHECTHTYLDILNIGYHPLHQDEAVAYVVEAVYLEASGKPPISAHSCRTIAQEIAKKILAADGWFVVDPADTRRLVDAIAATPLYAGKTTMLSDGFKRDWARDLFH